MKKRKPADVVPIFKKKDDKRAADLAGLKGLVLVKAVRSFVAEAKLPSETYLAALLSEVARLTEEWPMKEVCDLFDQTLAEIESDKNGGPKPGGAA